MAKITNTYPTNKQLLASVKNNLYGTFIKGVAQEALGVHDTSWSKMVLNIDTKDLYLSVVDACLATGANRGRVSEAARGKIPTAGGYHWCYLSTLWETHPQLVKSWAAGAFKPVLKTPKVKTEIVPKSPVKVKVKVKVVCKHRKGV
jgi:hypothetical protein